MWSEKIAQTAPAKKLKDTPTGIKHKVDHRWSAPDFPFAWCEGLGEVVRLAGP